MHLNPKTTAIIAMDFQPTILSTLENPEPLLARVREAIRVTRAQGGYVSTVRVAFTPEELSSFPASSKMGLRMQSIADKVMSDASSTQVVSEIGAAPVHCAVRKTRVGPFLTTDLDTQLRNAGIDTVVFAGIHTSGCVLTGVREANDLDYRIIVLSDACADPDTVAHDALMHTIFPKQADVMSVSEYSDLLLSESQ